MVQIKYTAAALLAAAAVVPALARRTFAEDSAISAREVDDINEFIARDYELEERQMTEDVEDLLARASSHLEARGYEGDDELLTREFDELFERDIADLIERDPFLGMGALMDKIKSKFQRHKKTMDGADPNAEDVYERDLEDVESLDAREFDDEFDIEAREFDDELDLEAREFDDQLDLEARDFEEEDLEARYDGLLERHYDELMERELAAEPQVVERDFDETELAERDFDESEIMERDVEAEELVAREPGFFRNVLDFFSGKKRREAAEKKKAEEKKKAAAKAAEDKKKAEAATAAIDAEDIDARDFYDDLDLD